jgi:hypothetical protein
MFHAVTSRPAPAAKLRRYAARLRHALLARVPRDAFARGSPQWLALTEQKYGGVQWDVPRRKVSERDPRSDEQLKTGGMVGGDRMSDLHHGYARTYAQYLKPFIETPPSSPTVVEVGILNGSGLAMWADLFPSATIIGLDIDLSHFKDNLAHLRSLGAFRDTKPSVHEFDQFLDNTALLGRILDGRRIDVMIDDGYHSDETIRNIFEAAEPYLADRFVYFVEDNDAACTSLKALYPTHRIECRGELTVIHRP